MHEVVARGISKTDSCFLMGLLNYQTCNIIFWSSSWWDHDCRPRSKAAICYRGFEWPQKGWRFRCTSANEGQRWCRQAWKSLPWKAEMDMRGGCLPRASPTVLRKGDVCKLWVGAEGERRAGTGSAHVPARDAGQRAR